MDKLVEHAIRMLEIVEGENDFFRNDAKRQADIARAVYDTILRVQALERNADRKTESSSEKPNNCEDKPTEITYQNCSDALLKMWMDNVLTDAEYNRIMDKLNNAQRKDEPQTDCAWR